MKEIFEAVANTLNWNFHYGREDFHNAIQQNPTDNPNYLFVDPVDRKPVYGVGGGLSHREYSGRFLVLRNSDLDEVYDDSEGADGKYQLYIRPLIEQIESGAFHHEITCTYNLRVEWEIKEVINVFSENWDGILVSYRFIDYELNREL